MKIRASHNRKVAQRRSEEPTGRGRACYGETVAATRAVEGRGGGCRTVEPGCTTPRAGWRGQQGPWLAVVACGRKTEQRRERQQEAAVSSSHANSRQLN